MPKYFIYVTINHPKGEMEYSQEAGDLNSVMAEVVKRYPSATSVVMSICPNKDGEGVTFDEGL